jgi:hypothetical protein
MTTAAASGDSYVQFTETFGFLTSAPGGTQLFLTDVAGPAVGAETEKELWTSRGDGANTAVVNTATGWTSPIFWTVSGGGAAIVWYTRQLNAFTLSGLVRCNIRAHESNLAANASIGIELAVCDSDGTNVTVWALGRKEATINGSAGEITNAEAAWVFDIAGADLAVADGQRLRLRVFIDDCEGAALATGQTCTLTYDGTSGGATGDSYVTLSQSVSEFTPPERVEALYPAMIAPDPSMPRARSW